MNEYNSKLFLFLSKFDFPVFHFPSTVSPVCPIQNKLREKIWSKKKLCMSILLEDGNDKYLYFQILLSTRETNMSVCWKISHLHTHIHTHNAISLYLNWFIRLLFHVNIFFRHLLWTTSNNIHQMAIEHFFLSSFLLFCFFFWAKKKNKYRNVHLNLFIFALCVRIAIVMLVSWMWVMGLL